MAENITYLNQFTSRKVKRAGGGIFQDTPDSLEAWMTHYLDLVVKGTKVEEKKIQRHLERFLNYFLESYGHDKISVCIKRDVTTWLTHLEEKDLAPATINNHLASLSGFTTWVANQAPDLFSMGNPTKGIGELALPPLEPRTLSDEKVRSLKNICDRLERFHQLKGRRWGLDAPLKAKARPCRDRAIVNFLLSTGLRREELVNVNIEQLVPNTPEELRSGRMAKVVGVKGKGKTERNVFLSSDARTTLAAYLEKERPRDVSEESKALFLTASELPARKPDGRMSPESINRLLEQIARWHDAEFTDSSRHISPLHPHALRHTFAFQLSEETDANSYELQRRLGHRSERYIQRYTSPPEEVAAGYVEDF